MLIFSGNGTSWSSVVRQCNFYQISHLKGRVLYNSLTVKHFILGLSLSFLSLPLLAQTFAQRADETYLKTDKNFDLSCTYSFNQNYKLIRPKAATVRGANSLYREFTIETLDKKIPMTFKVERSEKSVDYSIVFNGVHESKGKLKKNEFFIVPLQDRNFANEFETHRMICQVNFAYAEAYPLYDGDYHINVHPHTIYDWQNRITKQIESYFADSRYQSIILLEAGNGRGNLVNYQDFFNGVDYKLPAPKYQSHLEEVSADIPMIVSPAGNSRYEIKAQSQINIIFSGGNHNYCIWNATRHVIENLMLSTSEAKVRFTYDTNAIIAQTGGVEGVRINFSRQSVKRSNLLKDLLADEEVQKSYHPAYLSYFSGYLAREYAGMYKTFKIIYSAPGYSTTVVLKGQGVRDLEVTMDYL